ncbi:MAG TPA: carbohydrate-binding family 6 protein, partial [Opitutus sp.]|nr:carbohydrate-binding family 6 protein [Opitutus sp.]
PDFVREFIKNMPVEPTRGFYYGSDQWIWGRDFLDLNRTPDAPRQLEMEKHWYHWLLWGRLGYDPDLSNERLIALLAERFPSADAARLFAAWQEASMIYPLTTGFHWGRFDFQWYLEGSKSRPEPARTPTGFHDLNRFISLPPHPATENISIPDYVRSVRSGTKPAGTTPMQVAERLQQHADRALASLSEKGGGGRPDRHSGKRASGPTAAAAGELHRTEEDIRAMAHLGKYYGHKIRAATELALYRATGDASHHAILAAELNQSALHWRTFASIALTYYQNPMWLNRVGHVNWRELYSSVLYEFTTTDSEVAIPSMPPTPGGTILEAEDARAERAPVRNSTAGFTGAGYRDMAGSQSRRWIEWTFNAPAAGRYVLEFRYAMRRQEIEPATLTINGEPAGDLVIWPTGGTSTWAWDRKIVMLPAGENSIRLNPPLGPNVDHLNVIPLE